MRSYTAENLVDSDQTGRIATAMDHRNQAASGGLLQADFLDESASS